jgi:hypothetical protein
VQHRGGTDNHKPGALTEGAVVEGQLARRQAAARHSPAHEVSAQSLAVGLVRGVRRGSLGSSEEHDEHHCNRLGFALI